MKTILFAFFILLSCLAQAEDKFQFPAPDLKNGEFAVPFLAMKNQDGSISILNSFIEGSFEGNFTRVWSNVTGNLEVSASDETGKKLAIFSGVVEKNKFYGVNVSLPAEEMDFKTATSAPLTEEMCVCAIYFKPAVGGFQMSSMEEEPQAISVPLEINVQPDKDVHVGHTKVKAGRLLPLMLVNNKINADLLVEANVMDSENKVVETRVLFEGPVRKGVHMLAAEELVVPASAVITTTVQNALPPFQEAGTYQVGSISCGSFKLQANMTGISAKAAETIVKVPVTVTMTLPAGNVRIISFSSNASGRFLLKYQQQQIIRRKITRGKTFSINQSFSFVPNKAEVELVFKGSKLPSSNYGTLTIAVPALEAASFNANKAPVNVDVVATVEKESTTGKAFVTRGEQDIPINLNMVIPRGRVKVVSLTANVTGNLTLRYENKLIHSGRIVQGKTEKINQFFTFSSDESSVEIRFNGPTPEGDFGTLKVIVSE